MLTFYATIAAGDERPFMPEVPVLLPASSWARDKFKLCPPKLPSQITERAADCGGFVATKIWGDYKYTPQEYVRWLSTWNPNWAATFDYCCEPEIAKKKDVIRDRQDKTTEMAWEFWDNFRNVPWTWVPTIQGWEVEDYQRHARQLRPLIKRMQKQGIHFRVGIGTLCRRASVTMIRSVVNAVSAELPDTKFHLWGVKLSTLQANIELSSSVKSIDSAAWNNHFGSAREDHKKSGMTLREYYYHIALPNYIKKVKKALKKPKQLSLKGM